MKIGVDLGGTKIEAIKISGHHNFIYPEMFAEFGLPAQLVA